MEVEKKRSSRIALLILETYPKIIKGSLAALGAMSPQQLKRLYLNGEKKLNKMLHLTANEKTTLKNLSETNGYDTCDFSLLYKLIRHFDLLESPNNGWTKKVTGINNIGDVVESLRRMRNDTIHRSNITFDEDEENKIFHKSLNIARITDKLLKRTTDTFEEDVKLLRSWDPEHKTRDKYIKALEKITELKKLGNLKNSGYDIAIFMKKDLTSTPTDINGRTPLTIYVKSGGMISSEAEAVSQHLNEIKDMINNKAYDIVFDSAETGSVIIHIAINNSILMNEVIMEQEMRDFVKRVFAFLDEEFLKNFSHNIECIFASSDTMFDEDDCEFDDYDENWLKLHVDVASSVQKDPNQLKNTVGQFVGDVFHATEAIHASDSPIEVHVHSKGNQRSHTQPMFEELSSTVESGSTGEKKYQTSGGNTRKRKGNFDWTLDENARKWKHIREDTIPSLESLEQDLRMAYYKIRAMRIGLCLGTPVACGFLIVASPFTSGTSLFGALGLAGTLFVSAILIENYLQRSVLEHAQKRVDNDKLATSKLREVVDRYSEKDFQDIISGKEHIFHWKLRRVAPYFIEDELQSPVITFLKQYITKETDSVLVAMENVRVIRKRLINELIMVGELLQEYEDVTT